MHTSSMSSMRAHLRSEIVRVRDRIRRTAKLNKRRFSTTLALLHGPGVVGTQWCDFIQKMFTEDLPEDCRDMNLDFITESIKNLGEDDVCNINNCDYKMLLLDAEVLKILKDRESIFRQCELMETQQEQVIVLLLGNENDMSFNHDARSTLAGLKDNEAFNIIQAKKPDQIFSDIMTVLSPMYVVPHPNIMSCEDRDQHLTLISNKPFPAGHHIEYIVEFAVGPQTRETAASLFNPYTLLLPNPGHSNGLANVKIFACTLNPHTENKEPEVSRTQIGEDLKVWFQSDLDKVYSILDAQTNPMAFLCQGIGEGRDPNRTIEENIDKLLTESFKKYVPDNKLSIVFGNAHNFGDEQDGNRPEYVPTLLHFSAMYGLRDLTAALLQCPGAVHAYGTANCDGDFPTNLAEKSGHWELRDFMHTYMEVAAMVHHDYGDRNNMQTSQIMSSMVYGQYLSFPTPEGVGIPEDIYVPIDSGAGRIDTPPGYVPMRGQALAAGLPQSVDYDYMIKRMLDPDPEPEKDYEELDLPGPPMGLSLDDRRVSAALTAPPLPPLPPPRDDKRPSPMGSLELGDKPMLLLPAVHSNLSPAQEELISLQKKVKDGELTINQAVFRFKEWERKHKERAASFQYQQENLQRIRNSLMKSREEKKQRGESTTIKITDPIIAGSSTYDQVLLKTRKEVAETMYGTAPKPPPGKRPSFEQKPEARQNVYSPSSSDGGSFKHFRTSIKKGSFGRPGGPPVPDSPGRPFHHPQGLSSRGSSIASSRSSTSSHSTSSNPYEPPPPLPPNRITNPNPYDTAPQLPPSRMPNSGNPYDPAPQPLPPRPFQTMPGRFARGSVGDDNRPPRLPIQSPPPQDPYVAGWGQPAPVQSELYAPPPVPPRDDNPRYGRGGGPAVGPRPPPRSPVFRP